MITRQPDGTVEFRVFATRAERLQLLGTFTGWEQAPIDLAPEGDGWFSVRVRIEPGDHEFQYLADGSHWMADFAAFGVRVNDFGLWVSQLHVAEVISPRLVVETRKVRPTPTPAPGGLIRTAAA